MFRAILVAIATVSLISTGMIVAATPAQADTPRCVTRHEYKRVHHGMKKRHVRRIFDVRGIRTSYLDRRGSGATWGYSLCGHPWDVALVGYSARHRVKSKRWNVPAFS